MCPLDLSLVVTDIDSGNEIGPFRAVEESTLAHLTPHEALPDIFAWYSLIGTAGTALGMMACGWMVNLLKVSKNWDFVPACRVVFYVYAGIGGLKFLLSLGLSRKVEAVKKKDAPLVESQQQQSAAETQPLLGNNSVGNGNGDASNGRTEPEEPRKKSLFASLDKSLVDLCIRLFILFALDSFASGLASL